MEKWNVDSFRLKCQTELITLDKMENATGTNIKYYKRSDF